MITMAYICGWMAVILFTQSLISLAAARWHTRRSYVVTHGEGSTMLERLDDGLAREAEMRANPPWYVRWTNWIERKTSRG